MSKKFKRNIRPNASLAPLDAADGLGRCDQLHDACLALLRYGTDLDAYQEQTAKTALDYSFKLRTTIEETGQFTEGQLQALRKWEQGAERVRRQLEDQGL